LKKTMEISFLFEVEVDDRHFRVANRAVLHGEGDTVLVKGRRCAPRDIHGTRTVSFLLPGFRRLSKKMPSTSKISCKHEICVTISCKVKISC